MRGDLRDPLARQAIGAGTCVIRDAGAGKKGQECAPYPGNPQQLTHQRQLQTLAQP
jgi:hypothetical protein